MSAAKITYNCKPGENNAGGQHSASAGRDVLISLAVGVVSASDMELMEAMESGDMKTAVALAKKTLATKPNDYDANLAMAFHYEAQENYAEQVKCLNKCLKVRPRSPEVMNSLAMAYLNLGENSVLEGYAGFGYGGVWRNADGTSSRKDGESSSSSSYAYSGRYMLPFVQANIGWHDVGAAHFGFAFGLKAGAYMPDFEYNEFNANGEAIAHRYEHYTRGNLLLEPQVQLSLGGEHVRWVSRLGFAWLSDVSAGEGSTTFMNDWFTVGTGIQLSF